ncbi:MAG: hypothetical protein ACFCU6_03870 [Balneolaceae bacterium]
MSDIKFIKMNGWNASALLVVCLLILACNDLQNPVADISVTDSAITALDGTENDLNKEAFSDPVQVNNYIIQFNGMDYNETDDMSTFNYTVTRGDDAEGFNFLFFETPSCADLPVVNFSPNTGIDEEEIVLENDTITGIK